MGLTSVRINSVLQFDENTEGDLIDIVEDMKQKHKLGVFLSNAVRLAVDKPGTSNEGGRDILEDIGVSAERLKYIDIVKRGILIIDNKLNSLYDEAEKLKVLALMGKHMGLEERADNIYRAEFLLRKQRNSLASMIGVDESKLNEVSTEELKRRAEDVLEFIISSYDSVVGEIKASVVTETVVPHIYTEPVKSTEPVVASVPVKASEATITGEDEEIDFGNADFEELGNFFG